MSKILEGATPVKFRFPDWSSVEQNRAGQWFFNKACGNGDWTPYPTAEAAAQALANIGQGPASVKKSDSVNGDIYPEA